MIPGSDREHPTFVRSFRYALEGFVTAVTTERNIKVQLAVGVAAIIAGFTLRIDGLSWVLVILCIGLVIFAELVNTAIEAIVDLATQELHPLAKRAKDIAAASVFTLSITSAIVGAIVFIRAFLQLGL
ncbi:diacylglycerol kinase family protein [Collinsella intestinalis]|uniref:diacylglycerol kinase family protein n=1 Tax=Collinsella intestinalis TaxID=147207 RepID=UPI00195A3F52|nr:diacylglycerol kinase family protein [Collinsella intestinalis]MBM6682974.1 diacylglycerol kinase family protein [Collinsella intestinalis]